MAYLLDANVLIQAKKLHYGRGMTPRHLRLLAGMAASPGQVGPFERE